MATLVLVYEDPEVGERRFELEPGKSYRIGKSADNDIVISRPDVSRSHAVVYVQRDGVRITDVGSKNGTCVNGKRIISAMIRCGDRITLSSAELLLTEVSSGAFRIAEEIEPVGDGPTPSPDSETREYHPERGPEVYVDLLERTAGERATSASTLLAWIVEAFGIEGALAIASGRGGEKAVACSAGLVNRLLEGIGELEDVVRRVDDPTASNPGGAGEVVIGEGVLGLRLDREHTLVLATGSGSLSLMDLRAIRAAMRQMLGVGQVRTVEVGRAPLPAGRGLPVGIVGNSRALAATIRRAREYAQLDEPVTVVGESGTGKELFARLIHLWSPRGGGPFVAVNCAAVPADLIEAELFGVAPGAATGVHERPGKFAAAEGGTLFLDEIGDFPLQLQGKLLRVLETAEYFRVGEDSPRCADVRIVAATNRDLTREVDEGRFRADLYYRLDVLPLEVPPLRERREDIPLLVNHFLATEARKLGRRVGGCTVRALEALTRYPWPGNVRELRAEVVRILAQIPDGAVIDLDRLSPKIVGAVPEEASRIDPSPVLDLPLRTAVEAFEREFIRRVLHECGGNQTRAAERLGMSRVGLVKKMNRLGVRGDGGDSCR